MSMTLNFHGHIEELDSVSPGAAELAAILRLKRAQERQAVIDRAKRNNLSARLARIADREGVIGW